MKRLNNYEEKSEKLWATVPARFSVRSPATVRHPQGEGFHGSTVIRSSLWEGLDVSICTYSCKSLSNDELTDHLQEAKRAKCRDRSAGGFVVSRKCSLQIISRQFHSSQIVVLHLQLDPNKTLKAV